MNKEKYWSRFADNFEEITSYVVGVKNLTAILQRLREYSLKGNVLELGCGNGTYSKIISETSENLVATDYSDEMVASAKERLKGFKNITIEKQNCMELSYNNEMYDTIVMANLLHIIDKPQKAIAEAKRVLKPHGKLVIISFTTEGLSFFNKLSMIYRYLKTYGKPPKESQVITLSLAKQFLEAENFKINEANLIGYNVKAIMIIAEKC